MNGKRKEPSQLRRGKRFHKLVQDAWADPNDQTFGVEKPVEFLYPSELAKKNRSDRMDIYFELSDDSGACIFEIKATDWDIVKHRRRLLGSHRRQVFKYVDQYLQLRNVSVVATMIYPRSPTGEGIREEVEDYMAEWTIQVMWYKAE